MSVVETTIARPAFDYDALDEGARIVVKNRTAEIHGLIRMTAHSVIKIGCKLAELKPLLAGHFTDWLRREFEWSDRTAHNFMNVYKRFGDEPAVSNFAPSALYLLAAPSTTEEVRNAAIKMAAAGEKVTIKKAKHLVFRKPRMLNTNDVDLDPEPEPTGIVSRLNGESGIENCPQMFYVNRLTVLIMNDKLNFKEDRLTYALHALSDLIKERVPRHPPG